MPKYTLTLLDTVSIQDYIFGSNVLRENIGASELVRRATRLWPFEEMRKVGKTNVKPRGDLTGDPEDLNQELRIEEDHDLNAEVIYAGGGNCAILFDSRTTAEGFVTRLSKRVLEEAPGLNLVVTHVDVEWGRDGSDDVLADKVKEALDRLVTKKLERRVSTPLLGQSTTMACRSTGLPAVGTTADEPNLKPAEEAPRAISAGILAKLRVLPEANRRLEQLLPQFQDGNMVIPYDFDNFGREAGDISYIAVVHTDGNGMGDRIEKLRSHHSSPQDNRPYIQAMRDFSQAVEAASQQALGKVSKLLWDHWGLTEKGAQDAIISRTKDDKWNEWITVGEVIMGQDKEKGRPYIPFRPIVFGGDDLTFVTDGRLGLSLAAAYLEAFEKAMEAQCQDLQGNETKIAEYLQDTKACAGVSVVKAHYPFARAYALSEDLCRNAKDVWEREHSALDWHFAASGLFGDIETIRQRQYATPDGRLEMRPVLLKEQPVEWRTWTGFAHVTKTFLVEDDWKDSRNKVIALREALRDGPRAVEQFRHAYELKELPLLAPYIGIMQTTGWDGSGRCGYFDAVEALDFFLPLEG